MRHGSFVLSALLALAFPPLAHATWPHDPYTYGVPLSTAAAEQSYFSATSDGAGGMIVAWMDWRGGNVDIYAQRVDASGHTLWTTNGVALCTQISSQSGPRIASDGAGGAIVAWTDYRNATVDVYAQRVNAAGTTLWPANGVQVCGAAGTQLAESILADGAGGAVVVWRDNRGATGYDIYAQRLNASGAPLWTANGVVVTNNTGDQVSPVLASNGSGGTYVVWQDGHGATTDIVGQLLDANGVPQWGTFGNAICQAANNQTFVSIAPDGSGGFLSAWEDARNTSDINIYAQRTNALGMGQWGNSDGIPVCSASGWQSQPLLCGDGSGGAFIAWSDQRGATFDVYAQRILSSGLAAWTTDGLPLCIAAGTQAPYAVVPDGSGGGIAVWQDNRTGSFSDVYAQRVSAAGTLMWMANGTPIAASGAYQVAPVAVSDGAGGAIVAYEDTRTGTGNDAYAMRIERNGRLGNPEPAIAAVRDVANDQGGHVKLSWAASYLDVEPNADVFDYRVWRSVPVSVAQARARGASLTADPDEAASTGALWAGPASVQGYAWEAVGTQAAAYLPSYSLVVETLSDSIAGSNPYTAFMVEARSGTSVTSSHWYSAPDSGYSVDDLAPSPPAPFTGTYGAGAANLYWGANGAADLAGYRLYRGPNAAFVPSLANRVAETSNLSYVDAAGQPYWYKLSAIDVHGNESAFVTLLPNGALAVDGPARPTAFAMAAPTPNPAHARTTLRFALPRDAHVRLALHDASGRLVRTLVDGARAAGEHAVEWDLRDDGGRAVGAGLFFARLEADGRTLTEKVLTLR